VPEANEPKGVRVSDVVEEMSGPEPELEIPDPKAVVIAGIKVRIPPLSLLTIKSLSKAAREVVTRIVERAVALGGSDVFPYTEVARFVFDEIVEHDDVPQFLAELSGLDIETIEEAELSEVVTFLRTWIEAADVEGLARNFTQTARECKKAWGLLSEKKRPSHDSPQDSSEAIPDTDSKTSGECQSENSSPSQSKPRRWKLRR